MTKKCNFPLKNACLESHTATKKVLVMIMFSFFLVILLVGMTSAWADYNFDKRKVITVTENSGIDQNINILRLNISYDSDMNSDWSDLRFYDPTDLIELDYYLWNTTSDYALIDVEVNLTGGITQSIFMYYDNSSAISVSSGEDTYIWFEDFEDETLGVGYPSGWTDVSSTGFGFISGDTGQSYGGTQYFQFNDSNAGANNGFGNATVGIYTQGKYIFQFKNNTGTELSPMIFTVYDDGGVATGGKCVADSHLEEGSGWTDKEFRWNATYSWNVTNGNILIHNHNLGQCGGFVWGGIASALKYNASIDNIALANWTYPEPTTSTGSEENSDFNENSQTYTHFTSSGASETFTINISYNSNKYSNVQGKVKYNDSEYISTQYGNGDNTIFNVTFTIPSLTSTTNISFNWTFTLIQNSSHKDIYNSTTNQQRISPIVFDNCTTYSFIILNLSMRDEDSKDFLNGANENTSIAVDLDLYSEDRSLLIYDFFTTYNETNPLAICTNETAILNNSQQYRLDAQIKYSSTGRATEYHHIQNYLLTNSTGNQNITLYDLLSTSNQPFKIIYKDENYLPVSGAIITVQRKYVGDGIFRTVEVPKTDSNGQTLANLVVNNVIYNFIVSKNGVILGNFNNMRVYCQTPTLYECVINLNTYSSSIPVTNFTLENNFYYVLTYSKSTRTITADFNILDGTDSLVTLNVSKEDALGTFIDYDSITSSSGTLTVTVPANIGNGTIIAKIYKDGILMGFGQMNLSTLPSTTYSGLIVFLTLFIILTLFGAGLSDNPVFTVIFFMIGVVLLFALNLVANNGFLGAGATILWLVIAIILIIIKGSKRT